MSEMKQEWGDDILQVDSLKPEAAPDEPLPRADDGLTRTTAGQDDRQSPPPESKDDASEGPT
ncbi:MAG: hypothetical protein AB7P33_07815 [Dehalococcoidia bacterium]